MLHSPDCGWTENADEAFLTDLKKWIKHIDAVFLSHSTPRHLGLLPYLVGKCGLKCPIYATIPTAKLGHLCMYDAFQSLYATQDIDMITLDDVDAAFEKIITLKYHQTLTMAEKGHGITVTPLQSGHVLGGTIWKFLKDDTDIVYAKDYNHKKERHLNGAAFDACGRPYLLIMDGSNALYAQPKRKDRDEFLRGTLHQTLRNGGNVLIVSDTAGRSLEIAHYLEQTWHAQDSGLMPYGLAILNNVAFNVFDVVRSLIEWMSKSIMLAFEDQRTTPFAFRHLQLCHTLDHLDNVPDPKVVIASMDDLKSGFSRQLFAEWCTSEKNTVILTARSDDRQEFSEEEAAKLNDREGLVSRLIGLALGEQWAKAGLTEIENVLQLPFTIQQRVLLPAEEYKKSAPLPFLGDAEEKPGDITDQSTFASASATSEQKELEERLKAPLSESDSSEESDSEEEETDGLEGPGAKKRKGGEESRQSLNHAMVIDYPNRTAACGRHQPGYDINRSLHSNTGGQWFRTAKRTQLVFPAVERSVQWDDYGQRLTPELVVSMIAGPMSSEQQQQQQKRHTPNTAEGEKPEFKSPKSAKLGSARSGKQPDAGALHRSKKEAILRGPDTTLLNLFSQQNASQQLSKLFNACKTEEDVRAATENMVSRCITQDIVLPLRCQLHFVDYEGRSDGEAVKKIVAHLRPQELILVGAHGEAVSQLAEHCRSVFASSNHNCLIHVPRTVDLVNCTKEGDIYQARMKDSLVTQLKFTKIRDYELAWVDARLLLGEAEAAGHNQSWLEAEDLPTLVPAEGELPEHDTVFVNKPKLSDLKEILLSHGLQAEFVDGQLVVQNCVSIKRPVSHKLSIEGRIGLVYFKVRQILYQQFAIL